MCFRFSLLLKTIADRHGRPEHCKFDCSKIKNNFPSTYCLGLVCRAFCLGVFVLLKLRCWYKSNKPSNAANAVNRSGTALYFARVSLYFVKELYPLSMDAVLNAECIAALGKAHFAYGTKLIWSRAPQLLPDRPGVENIAIRWILVYHDPLRNRMLCVYDRSFKLSLWITIWVTLVVNIAIIHKDSSFDGSDNSDAVRNHGR